LRDTRGGKKDRSTVQIEICGQDLLKHNKEKYKHVVGGGGAHKKKT